jgi:hypothetical protein
VTHRTGASWAPVRRSLVIGDRLITVSERGVETSGVATLAPRGLARFPVPPQPAPHTSLSRPSGAAPRR